MPSYSSVLPTSQVFRSGYINWKSVLYFSCKIIRQQSTRKWWKTLLAARQRIIYSNLKWFSSQSHWAYLLYLSYKDHMSALRILLDAKWNVIFRSDKSSEASGIFSILGIRIRCCAWKGKVQTSLMHVIYTWYSCTWECTVLVYEVIPPPPPPPPPPQKTKKGKKNQELGIDWVLMSTNVPPYSDISICQIPRPERVCIRNKNFVANHSWQLVFLCFCVVHFFFFFSS